jgi:diguanylate cyclase (GGDEF)-like protein
MTETTLSRPAQSAPKQTTRALLTITSGPSTGRAHTVRDGETMLGRGREAHVRVDDAGASRLHARITALDEGRYVIDDLGSTNGTFVGGKRIQHAELHSGDRINIGPNVSVSFSILDSQAELVAHRLYESSVRDPLTQSYNRRYLVDRLTSEVAYAKRHRSHLALILFDLDHFKRVNDTHGHLAGDEVLREVSALVGRLIRSEDVFARFGGEEFIVLARGIEHVNAGRFAERIRVAIERLEIASEGALLHVTVSVGYASVDELAEPQRDAEGLIRLADERVYKAKAAGRNRICGD